jgi:hypothetical protein
VYKQKHRLFRLDSSRAILSFSDTFADDAESPVRSRLDLQKTVSTMISRWTHTCFSELRLMIAPRERAESIERGRMLFSDLACHVTWTHYFRASECGALLTFASQNQTAASTVSSSLATTITANPPHHIQPASHTHHQPWRPHREGNPT